MTECNGIVGYLFGHKFEPAYNYAPPTDLNIKGGDADDQIRFINAMTKRTVYAIVCPRCGKSSAKEAT